MYQYEIVAGEKQQDGSFSSATVITVRAKNDKEAFKKAQSMAVKNDYWIRAVSEIDNGKDDFLKSQEKMFKLLIKAIK